MSRRIRMTVAYDGTNYAGWQRQNNGMSVQQKLEEAFYTLFREEVRVDASGRTDAGVHAEGQVAAVTINYPIPVRKLSLALNSTLPEDIRVLDAEETDPDFNPQYEAKRKTYRYSYYNGTFLLPQYRLYMTHVHEPLDIAAMQRAAQDLIGEHDFTALSSAQRQSKTTARTIYDAKVYRDASDPKVIRIEVTGNGFLYNMVRIIAGTLVDVGRGRLPEDIIRRAIETKDRTIAGVTAPPQGLCLMQVEYEEW